MATHVGALNVGYDEFGDWYNDYRTDVLEPALAHATAALHDMLDDVLSDRDLVRIRNISGRVKSKRRTWRKLNQQRFDGDVTTPADIPSAVYDLIGLRITCTNVRDIDMVQGALESLPRRRGRRGALWLDADSERDYVIAPKDSGYRAWHVNLGVTIEQGGRWVPVTCELQVRTLLQDSWGELTHEDTYSKDGALPPLVEVLSKRMADLFAILDDIAEDLRTELDRIDEAAVAERGHADAAGAAELDPLVEQAADAATFLIDRWRNLDRPTALAGLAWALQREFGAEITDDWFGHGGFKRFLRHAMPDAVISTGRQPYLLRRLLRPIPQALTAATQMPQVMPAHRPSRAMRPRPRPHSRPLPARPDRCGESTAPSHCSKRPSGATCSPTSLKHGGEPDRYRYRPRSSTR